MDIRCPKCGEPWDADCIHDIADDQDVPYNEATALFRKHGCIVLGSCCNDQPNEMAAMLAGVAAELNGDDIDGFASDMEDAEFLGLFD